MFSHCLHYARMGGLICYNFAKNHLNNFIFPLFQRHSFTCPLTIVIRLTPIQVAHQAEAFPSFRSMKFERHCESKVSCPRTKHNVLGQGSNPDRRVTLRLTSIKNTTWATQLDERTNHEPAIAHGPNSHRNKWPTLCRFQGVITSLRYIVMEQHYPNQ